jgi:hypothetical protein
MPENPAPIDRNSVLQTYLTGLAPDREALTRQLDAAIRTSHPGFDLAVKYGILMYALGGDWRHWVVALDARPRTGVGLRFLYGVLMADPRHVLRGGSSVLMTWDFAPGADVDAVAVGDYVAEAVRLYPEYRANDRAILESARASSSSRGGAKLRGSS